MSCQTNAQSSPKCVIIGAGMAGISCAVTLFNAGIKDVLVFEAADRIGGRIWTIDNSDCTDDPYILEKGASWIHGVVGNPIFKLAKQYGLLRTHPCAVSNKKRDEPRHMMLGFTEDGQQVNNEIFTEVSSLFRKYSDIADTFFEDGLPKPWNKCTSFEKYMKSSFNSYWDDCKFNEKDRTIRRAVLKHRLDIESGISGCDSMNDVSLDQIGSYEYLNGGDPVVGQGYDKIVQALAKQLPDGAIKLNSPVDKVKWDSKSKDPVTVVTSNESYLADIVINTSSLGCLKQKVKAMYEPSLPKDKLNAINKLDMGTVDKIFLKFENLDFLPPRCARVMFYWDKHSAGERDDEVPRWCTKITSMAVVGKANPNMLIVWITGKAAETMEKLPEAEVGAACAKVLGKFLSNPNIPTPVQVIRTEWGTNPYTNGSYSYIPVGATIDDVNTLAEPVINRKTKKPCLMFAGEATHHCFYSTTHGAHLSGLREAQRIIDALNKDTSPLGANL